MSMKRWPSAVWRAWVALWDGVEHPRSLGLVRILLGLVILWDFLEIVRLDLVGALFVGQAWGGLSDAATRADPPWWVDLFGATVASGRALHAVLTAAAACFVLGFFTRVSAVVVVFAWAQFAQVLPASDRGIDTLCRDVLLIFWLARSGDWLSLDALRRTGSIWGDGTPVPAWPRRLLMLQIVAMYFLAGIQKTGIHWWPMGHFAALYFILQDPAIARFDFRWLSAQPFFFLTQLGSFVTILFQDTYPVVLLFRWAKTYPDGPGRFRQWLLRYGWLEWVWIATGALFHLLLAATTELGIFPWAMLALYPAWLHPDEWQALWQRMVRRKG
jgi:hypothetical protein